MILNSNIAKSGLTVKLGLVVGLVAFVPSSFAARFDPNGIEWTNARGVVQHLHSLQSMPTTWSSALENEDLGKKQRTPDECLRLSKPSNAEFEKCTQLVLSAVRDPAAKKVQTKESLKQRFAIYIALAEGRDLSFSWSAWLSAASVFVMLEDFDNAQRMIERSRKSAQQFNDKSTWQLQRIAVFEFGLMGLKSGAKRADVLPKVSLSENDDPQSRFLLSTLDGLISREASVNKKASISSEKSIEDSKRMRWIVRQDRDEIENIRREVLKANLSLELLRRIESICRQHQVESKEWRTALTAVLGVSSKVEFLARNDGLRLALDSWMSRDGQMDHLISFDDDPALSRQGLVLDELINNLQILFSNSAEKLVVEEDRKVISLLSERLRGMQSKMGRGLSRFAVDESIRKSILLKQILNTLDIKIRDLNSRFAAIDMLGSQGTETNGYQREIRVLNDERRKLLIDFVSSSLNLIPHSTAEQVALKERVQQVKRTLSDLERILAGPTKKALENTQAGQLISESMRLLDRIKAESEELLSRKQATSKKISKAIADVSTESSSLLEGLNQFMGSAGKLLQPQLLKLLASVDTELYKRERSLELAEQIARDEIRSEVLNEKTASEWRRERIIDARRVRSESLEWRSGR